MRAIKNLISKLTSARREVDRFTFVTPSIINFIKVLINY